MIRPDEPEPVTEPVVTGFADAVASVMALPLSDAEKAEAVRRLIGGAV